MCPSFFSSLCAYHEATLKTYPSVRSSEFWDIFQGTNFQPTLHEHSIIKNSVAMPLILPESLHLGLLELGHKWVQSSRTWLSEVKCCFFEDPYFQMSALSSSFDNGFCLFGHNLLPKQIQLFVWFLWKVLTLQSL